jgi:protein involved in polysaccharide export with SLBB domain
MKSIHAISRLLKKLLCSKACWTVLPGLVLLFLASGAAAQTNSNSPGNAAVPAPAVPSAQSNGVPPASPTVENANSLAQGTNSSHTDATNRAIVLDDKHKLAIGDRLSFRIVEDEDWTNLSLFVTDSGDIDLPYIGRVPAEGKTCKDLGAEIKTALEKDFYYHATVSLAVDVMSKSRGRVYLVGAVRMPGPVEIPSDETLTLSKAILRAGGFTDFADRHHVKVTRVAATTNDAAAKDDTGKDNVAKEATTTNSVTRDAPNKTAIAKGAPGKDAAPKDATGKDDKKTFIVDVGEIFDKGKVETDLVLEPGDLIYTPDRLIRF